MRKFLISAALIATAATAVATPAAAQYNRGNYGYANQGQGIDRQVRQLRQRIDQLAQRRLISNRERANLHSRAAGIERRLWEYSRNGLSGGEHRDIQNRVQDLRQRLQNERFEGRNDRRDDRRNRW